MKNLSIAKIIIGGILLFHIFVTLHSFYSMFSNFTEFTLYHVDPFAKLVFTIAWAGIFLKQRIFGLIYFSLIVIELMMKIFFQSSLFGNVLGDIFYPADLLFVFVILMLYKQIFGERSAQ